MLREYQSIPQTRLACKIEESGQLEQVREGVMLYTNKTGAITEVMVFSYPDSTKPEVGDYIVQIDPTDVYLMKKELFEKTYRSTVSKLC